MQLLIVRRGGEGKERATQRGKSWGGGSSAKAPRGVTGSVRGSEGRGGKPSWFLLPMRWGFWQVVL